MIVMLMPPKVRSRSDGLDPQFPKAVGARLKQARERASLTLEEVSTLVGVARQVVWLWEAGHTLPMHERMARLAGLYNVSVDWLLGGADPKQLRESTATYGASETPPTEEEARLMREFLRYLRQQRSSSGETQDTINRRNEQ